MYLFIELEVNKNAFTTQRLSLSSAVSSFSKGLPQSNCTRSGSHRKNGSVRLLSKKGRGGK